MIQEHTYWKKHSSEQIRTRVFGALKQNVNYRDQEILGIPASHLDNQVFSQDESFLKEAPYISTLVQNPNHIGCHTLGTSEPFFRGTQEIEKETIELCAVDILNAAPNTCDGYIASGGTEANMQAIWMYRNYYLSDLGATHSEIAILCSEDAHYSMDKAANLLNIPIHKVKTTPNGRDLTKEAVEATIADALSLGRKHFIVIANMMNTMYGSVDDVSAYTSVLKEKNLPFKLHIDGAYGGFYFPFSSPGHALDFSNEDVSSATLDAHKMAQAPYGTGIFIARKGLISYTNTKAGYVEGDDFTMIGSRSGANAIAVWMILMTNGPYGWHEKIFILQKRTQWMCDKLDEMNIAHYRNAGSNIITMNASQIPEKVAKKYGLVPDSHTSPSWYKVVIMDHVTLEKIKLLLNDLDAPE